LEKTGTVSGRALRQEGLTLRTPDAIAKQPIG